MSLYNDAELEKLNLKRSLILHIVQAIANRWQVKYKSENPEGAVLN